MVLCRQAALLFGGGPHSVCHRRSAHKHSPGAVHDSGPVCVCVAWVRGQAWECKVGMTCDKCGKTGHRASECTQGITCHRCGRPGHFAKDCKCAYACVYLLFALAGGGLCARCAMTACCLLALRLLQPKLACSVAIAVNR